MEYFNWILQQDFNKIYTNIENCVIVKPPYLDWRVPHTFYFDKRGAFEIFETLGYDRIYDTISETWWDYYIWSIWTDVVLKKWNTTLKTTPNWQDRNFKFIYWTSVKWNMHDSGTGLVSNETDPLNIFLRDSSKSWTTNELAGKYVYVFWGDAWVWQVIRASWNNSTDIFISWVQGSISNWSYKIFDEIGSIPFFLGWDWLYGIHSDTEIIKCDNFATITDIVFVHDRFFSSDANGNINKWGKGQFILYQDETSSVTTVQNILSMTSFQDYLLILGTDTVSLIKKETISVWGESTEEFTWSLVTRDFWLFAMWAFEIYNEWLYLVDSNKKFISLSINSVTDTKFTTAVSDEWIYIQKDLDQIWVWSHVRVYIDSNEIKIINTWEWYTNMYIYDRYYKWWHKWDSGLEIYGYYHVADRYFWKDLYKLIDWQEQDSGWLDINQKIKFIFWEENITAFKTVIFQKVILWTHTDEWIIVDYKISSWQDLIRFPKSITWTKLLQQGSIEKTSKGSVLGQTILGLWLLWDNDETLDYLYPKVWTVKINLGYSCEMMESEFVATSWKRIVFGWLLIGYQIAQPWLTSVKNVI